MPVRAVSLLVACCLTVGVSGCDQAQQLADDARSQVEEGLATLQWCSAAFRLGAAVANRDAEAARDAARDLRDNAPEELQDEVELILSAIEDAQADDFEALASEDVRAAGQRVLDEARARCDPSTDPNA